MTYMICDEHGTAMADGYQDERRALSAAQASANRLGRTVYVYGPDDTDETATPVTPDDDGH